MGSLEADVLALLWARAEPATPAEVLDLLGTDLAYTTVLTILLRLWQKGLLERERVGRAYAYRPKVSEADYAAQHMEAALTRTRDRAAALNRFVDNLSERDAAVLRALLDAADQA
jgi:predicted transcriptional regulator